MSPAKQTCVNLIESLQPNSHWTWTGEDYSGLVWLDDPSTKPTANQLGL
jgi:hypothetical protein